jgi:serine/threonine-protein kinase
MKESPIQTASGSTASPLLTPGGIVGEKYRLDALIGEGGMGSVWSATHLGLNQVVAIKFVSREFVRSEEALRRFDSEAKAAALLRSRHVVQVFDTGTLADGTPYIAMELLNGETLQTRVHEGGPIPLGEAVEILSQCCKALGRAHAAGIIHRDIKPENIFLTEASEDEGSVVKILDFGIAKMSVSPNEQGSRHGATRTGAVLGTPLYMSPEQARALRTLDQRTDLYSLGLVAYTMFTGNLAFSSESFGDLLFQICTAPLPSLCANAAWLPPTMEAWFQRACAREPQERFASAQQFADALRLAAGLTLQPPASLLVPSRVPPSMPAREGPKFVSSPGTGPGISRTDDPIDAPSAAGKRRLGVAIVGAALGVVGGAAIAAFALAGRNTNVAAHATGSDSATRAPLSASSTAPANATSSTPPPVAFPAGEASSTAPQGAPSETASAARSGTAAAGPSPSPSQPSHASVPHGTGHKNPPVVPTAKAAVDLGY